MEEYSWDQKSKIKLIKNLDYSSFNHKTSVIPKNFYEFFGLENNSRDKIQINLINQNGVIFNSNIRHADKSRTTPAKLLSWDRSLDEYLKSSFPNWTNINKGEKTRNFKLTFLKTERKNEYFISTEVSHTIGIKKIRDSEIGNESSHATHIGLFENSFTNRQKHQILKCNIHFARNIYKTVGFIDFIERQDGSLNAPKLRKGTEEDIYEIAGITYDSAFVKLQEIFHSIKDEQNWYIIFQQNNKDELDFYLMAEASQEFILLNSIFEDSFKRKEITQDNNKYEEIVTYINLNFKNSSIPNHGIKNVWWSEEEKFYMVSPADTFEKLEENKLLWAPLADTKGLPSASNSMVALLKEGDIVFVYLNKKIIGYYEIIGNMYISSFSWTPSGRAGRKRGNKETESDGFTVRVSELTRFSSPITLDEIRGKSEKINNLREDLQKKFNGAIYFPFISQSRSNQFIEKETKELAGAQSYLTKFPKRLISILNIDIKLENNAAEDSDNPINRDGFVETQRREYDTYVTDKQLRDLVLKVHNYKCQFCKNKYEYININLERVGYAEGAHIKAKNPTIGGEDKLDNLLCLCPTCHKLFDLGALWMDDELTVRDIDGGIVYQLTEIDEHPINIENIRFHRNHFKERRN